MDVSYEPDGLLRYAPKDVSPKVLALLLRKIDSFDDWSLPAQPAAGDVKALIAQHGYKMAMAVARGTDDPQVLAGLAKHSSLKVRRVVAASSHLDQQTADYLWQWAHSNNEHDMKRGLAPMMSFATLLALIPRDRTVGTYCYSTAYYSVKHRLREGPDRTVENLRAMIGCCDINEALSAVVLCTAGGFEGMSYAEALDLFVEQQTRHDRDPDTGSDTDNDGTGPDRYVALCLRHTLNAASPPVDEEFATLIVKHKDRLVDMDPFRGFAEIAQHPPNLITYRRRYSYDEDPLSVKATPDAASILLNTGNLTLTNAFIGLADRSELRRELNAGNKYVAYWALSSRNRFLDSWLANQALSLLRSSYVNPPWEALRLPADIVIEDDLLSYLVHNSVAPNSDSLVRFVSGEFVQQPRPSMMDELVNGCWYTDGEIPPSEAAIRAQKLLRIIDQWQDKPWADDLIEALGPAMWGRYADNRFFAERLFAEFGDSVELWSGCLGLLEAGFPGSLRELVDTVWALFGDGLVRPDLTPPEDPEPGTRVDGPEKIQLF